MFTFSWWWRRWRRKTCFCRELRIAMNFSHKEIATVSDRWCRNLSLRCLVEAQDSTTSQRCCILRVQIISPYTSSSMTFTSFTGTVVKMAVITNGLGQLLLSREDDMSVVQLLLQTNTHTHKALTSHSIPDTYPCKKAASPVELCTEPVLWDSGKTKTQSSLQTMSVRNNFSASDQL